jgi:hypothetical protein
MDKPAVRGLTAFRAAVTALTDEVVDDCQPPTRQKRIHFTLRALWALLRGLSRDQILQELKDEAWEVQHQILTRWAWCAAQAKAIESGERFNRPFLCEVGPLKRRKTLDREFWCLLRFLPMYADAKAEFPLYLLYRGDTHQSPDFDLDLDVSTLGLEITEAESGRTRERKIEERVKDRICGIFCGEPIALAIRRRPAWQLLSDRIEDLEDWLRWLKSQPLDTTYMWPSNRMLQVTLHKLKEPGRFLLLDESGEDGRARGIAGDEAEQFAATSFLTRLEGKLQGGPPRTQPCLLLVYTNQFWEPDNLEKTRAIIHQEFATKRQALAQTASSRFQELWLMANQSAIRI